MTTSFDLGSTGAHTAGPQHVPPDARPLTTVIVGNSGSGKSTTSRGSFVEIYLREKRRTVIIDPTGIWWGLRFMADGSPGYPIAIVGGLYGDAPLREEDGARLADWIGAGDTSVIVDVSEMTIGERQEFATQFFAQLYKANRRPLHLIIDEADEFAPQNPMPEHRRMLHHVDRIVRRGRVRGFRPTMITQRPSVLHKNVMSQAVTLVAMTLLGSQDRDAVQAWIKGQGDVAAGKEVLGTLARLQVGEGWLWSPRLGILNRGRFPMFQTFDSSRTPKDDEPPVEPPGEFPYRDRFDDLRQLLPEDPPADGLLQAPPVPAAAYTDAQLQDREAYRRGRVDGFAQGYETATATLQGIATGIVRRGGEILEELRQIGSALQTEVLDVVEGAPREIRTTPVVLPRADTEAPAPAIAKSAPPPKARPPAAPASRMQTVLGLQGGAEKLLNALAATTRPVTWQEACVLAGFAWGNGFFYRGRKYLVDEGLVREEGSTVEVTPTGRKLLGSQARTVPTLNDLLNLWTPKLRDPAGRMLHAIALAPGRQMTEANLSKTIKIAPRNGFWYRGLKALKTNGLIEQEGQTFRVTTLLREAQDA